MFEHLISTGHRENDLLNYSLDKLELYYRISQQRKVREMSSLALSIVQGVKLGIVSSFEKKAQKTYNDFEKSLISKIKGPDEVNKISLGKLSALQGFINKKK